MRNIVFEQTEDGNQFTFKDVDGNENCFNYLAPIDGLWHDSVLEDFDVQLLIHPYLNRESNVFALRSNLKTKEETVGYIFPVSVLDSDSFAPKRPSDQNYLFISYRVLLERLPRTNGNQSLGACFEDNLCVCVLNLRTIGRNRGVWSCIHSLRKYGYSYFIENNGYKEIDGYTYEDYKGLLTGKSMHVDFGTPLLYSNSIIDGILRLLPNADNLVYRFILLYQIVEFIISEKVSSSVREAIDLYYSSISPSENDFIETINGIRKERGVIKDILDSSQINASLSCNKCFNDCCQHLFSLAGIVPQDKDMGQLFYSFRNQMVHSYRKLSVYKEELADTIFYFEQMVLAIVEKYPYTISD